jgi:hypothetical protein
MSLLPSQTNINLNEYFFLRGTGQQLTVSTLNANNISTNTLTANSIDTSTISSLAVDIDGQLLTATPTELLLNGIPLATTSNLSSIADWSLDPAISTVQMNGNNINAAGSISTTSIVGGTAFFGQLMAINSMFLSTYTSTISSLVEVADEAQFSTLTAGNASGGEFTPSTLWGQPSSFYAPYTPNPNPSYSTLTIDASGYISTPQLYVSSINGSEFNSTGIIVQVAGVSSLVANTVSSIGAEIRTALVSTLQFNPSFSPNLDVNLGLGSLFGNLAGAASGALGVLVGGAALGTGIAALSQSRQTNYINSNAYELVNGTTQLQVSTLSGPVTSVYRFVNSASPSTPGEEVFISTVTGTGTYIRSLSDPLNTVSSPNSTIQAFGQWVQLPDFPAPSTVSSFNNLFTSSLGTSTVSFVNNTQLRPGASFQNSSGVSTLELLWEAAAPPLDADMRVGGLVISGNDVGGLNYSKDVLIQNANNGQRLLVYGPAGTSFSTIAFLSDIPVIPPTVSSFQTASVSSLSVSSVNGGIPYTTANPQPAPPVVSTFNTASVSSATISSINGGIPYTTLFPPSVSDSFSTLKVSTLTDNGSSTINIYNANVASLNFNLQTNGTGGQQAGLLLNASGGLGSSSNYATGPLYLNASTITMSTNQVQMRSLSTNQVFGVSSLAFRAAGPTYTFSSLMNLAPQVGTTGTSTLTQLNTDFSVGNNDIICGQLRVDAGAGAQVAEIVMTAPDGDVAALDVASGDATIRIRGLSTIGALRTGYLLDSTNNPPFFSTINNQVNLMSYFPSTTQSTIGYSTISKMNPVSLYGRSTLSGGALTVVFSPPYADSNEYSVQLTYQDTAGGNPLHANILSVSSFSANGNGTNNFFWQTIGRV